MPADRGCSSETPELPEPHAENAAEARPEAGEPAAEVREGTDDPREVYASVVNDPAAAGRIAAERREHRAAMPLDSEGRPAVDAEAYVHWYRKGPDTGDAPAPYDHEVADRLPEFVKGAKAEGLLVDEHGNPVWEQPVRSGYEGPAREIGGWKALGLPDGTYAIESHVEAHAAAEIRRSDLREATLYLNRAPCPGPKGCRTWLPDMIPEAAKTTVYAPDYYNVVIGRPEDTR